MAAKGLIGIALAYKNGERKLDDIPQGIRKHVKRLAKGISDDDAKMYQKGFHQAPRHRGRAVRIRKAIS